MGTALTVGPFAVGTVTGVDFLALLLLLHVWLLVAGIAVWQDDAQTGVAWVDQRVHMSPRLYAGLMLCATVVVWVPFALGEYPIGPNNPLARSRGAVFVFAAGGLLVGAGCYFLGGVLTNLRPALAVRRTEPVDAADVRDGFVQVSGRVEPIDTPLETPVSGTDAVCHQLSVREITSESTDSSGREEADAVPSGVWSLLVDSTTQVADERTTFALADDTGRVVVDPTDAQLRLERTASEPVPADAQPSEPLATSLLEIDAIEPTDRPKIYHESALEVGDEVTVLGIAAANGDPSPVTDEMSTAARPTITAGETGTEFVVAPGCEASADRHFLGSILGCGAVSAGLLAGGLWILSMLAGIG